MKKKEIVRYRSERVLKRMIANAEDQVEKWKDYGWFEETNFWTARLADLKAQLFALYVDKEEYDKLDTI